jgi:5-methylcytosine-specific restriction endonuclease McrA
VTYRCQGCRNYHRTVYRTIGLGSVCSPECEATVRTRQRGGRAATKVSDRRDSYFVEPAPGTGDSAKAASGDTDDSTNEDPLAAPGDAGDPGQGVSTAASGADDNRCTAFVASGDTDDIKIPDGSHQRDGIHDSTILDQSHQRDGTHDCLPFGDHDSKMTLRGELPATRGVTGARATPRQHVPRRTARSRDSTSVFERDGRCRYCGTRNNLHAHHIEYRSQGGSDDLHNLIALCFEHHDLVHTDKGLWQPLLRAYIWLLYIEGRRLFVLDIKRIYG